MESVKSLFIGMLNISIKKHSAKFLKLNHNNDVLEEFKNYFPVHGLFFVTNAICTCVQMILQLVRLTDKLS